MIMLRKLIGLILLVLLLASCIAAPEEPLTDELVATQVAIILTETALHESSPPAETLTPVPTSIEGEDTQIPTAMATMTSTATATSTSTATSTITKTQAPSDPAVLLGSPAWTYTFSGSESPWDFESDQAVFETSNGTLNLSALLSSNWHSWWVSSPKLKNAYVEATIKMDTCSGFDRLGFIVRASSNGEQFYFMDLTCDGRWGFFRMAPDVEIVTIKDYQALDGWSDSWSEAHRIGIWMDESTFNLYVDGEQVGSANDDKLSGEGYTGFMIAYANTPGFTVHVDQLRYWDVP